jgi:hypothetical protein
VNDVVLVRRLIVQYRRLALDRIVRGWRSCHGHPAFLSSLLRSPPLGAAAASRESSIATQGRAYHPAMRWAGRWASHGSAPEGRAAPSAHPAQRRAAATGAVKQPVVTAAHDDPRNDSGCQPGNQKYSQNERAQHDHLCRGRREDRTTNRCEAADADMRIGLLRSPRGCLGSSAI